MLTKSLSFIFVDLKLIKNVVSPRVYDNLKHLSVSTITKLSDTDAASPRISCGAICNTKRRNHTDYEACNYFILETLECYIGFIPLEVVQTDAQPFSTKVAYLDVYLDP